MNRRDGRGFLGYQRATIAFFACVLVAAVVPVACSDDGGTDNQTSGGSAGSSAGGSAGLAGAAGQAGAGGAAGQGGQGGAGGAAGQAGTAGQAGAAGQGGAGGQAGAAGQGGAGGQAGAAGQGGAGGQAGAGGAAGQGGAGGAAGQGGVAGQAGAAGQGSAAGSANFWQDSYNPSGSPTPPSGNHNAGKTCLSCHTGTTNSFKFGGTVYEKDGVTGAAHVQIGVFYEGHLYTTYSAANGNFWVWGSTHPSWIQAKTQVRIRTANGEKRMLTYGEPNCNNCHVSGNRIIVP